MENVEDFKRQSIKVFVDEIIPLLAPFEEERKKVYKTCKTYIVFGFIWLFLNIPFLIAVLMYVNTGKITDPVEAAIQLALMIDGFAALYFFIAPALEAKFYEKKVKKEVMPVLFKGIKNFEWSDKSKISDDSIKRFKILKNSMYREDDDNFSGTYKGIKIDITETKLEQSKGQWRPDFQGVLIGLCTEKSFNGLTLINQKICKINNCFMDSKGLKKVKLEDVEFDSKYEVFSNDQIQARILLTTAFMERFKNLAFVFKASKIYASFCENYILIALDVRKDLFKLGNVTQPIYKYKEFQRMIDELVSILELIDELKLNVNIGL